MIRQLTVYHPFKGFEDQLRDDLNGIVSTHGQLIITDKPPQKTYWAQNIWFDAQKVSIDSIGKAVSILKNMQRSWYPYSHTCHRRIALIQEKLPRVEKKRREYLEKIPKSALGTYTLLDKNTMIFSHRCSQAIPEGEMEFIEDKYSPPSRAYLKLWETFTRFQEYPKEGDKCLELGAAPGGWTWVLANLGCKVTSVDRATLKPSLMQNKLITHKIGDAFKFRPNENAHYDWIFSDLICYPERLYNFVCVWLNNKKHINFVCTIKLQGNDQKQWIEKFNNIPGSKITHLYHNKHELTWINLSKDR